MDTRGYRSARALRLPTNGRASLKPGAPAQVRAGQAVRASVRATYDEENPFQLLGRQSSPSPGSGEAVPANRLSLSTPVLVLPAQPGSTGGEVVGQQPPMLNLLGVARAVARAIGGSPKGSQPLEMPASGAEAMRGGGLGSTLGAPPAAKLVVRVVDGQGTERYRREQPLGHAAATTWEELAIGLTSPVDGSLEVWVENASIVPVWFDDLTVERGDVPTAVVVQEAHYDPWGLELAPLGYNAPLNAEDRFKFNGGSERETGLGLHWDETPFRPYDAQLGRFHGIDLLAGKFAPVSPFVYVLNNPLRFIDPTGMAPVYRNGAYYEEDGSEVSWEYVQDWLRSNDGIESSGATTHIAKNGDVLAITIGGDNKIMEIGTIADRKQFESGKFELGQVSFRGRTLQPYSFANFDDTFDKEGNVTVGEGASVQVGSWWAHNTLTDLTNSIPTFAAYATDAASGEPYDLKSHTPNGSKYYGSILYKDPTFGLVYCSARDAGNILAGIMAAKSLVPKDVIYSGFGALDIANGNKAIGGMSWGINLLPRFSYPLLPAPISLLPNSGEDKLSAFGIEWGYANYKKFMKR